MKKSWVICRNCGTKDASKDPVFENGKLVAPAHTGTYVTMRCPDCVENGQPLCRNCCPTGHGTRF